MSGSPHTPSTLPSLVILILTFAPSMLTTYLPIVTVIDMPIAHAPPQATPDFRNIDFTKFNESLQIYLQTNSPAIPITSKQQFHSKVDKLTITIQDTINNLVPNKKASPFSNIGGMLNSPHSRKRRTNLAINFSLQIPRHRQSPSQRAASQNYQGASHSSQNASKDHWQDWLKDITSQQIYVANKYVTDSPSDYSNPCIPTLKTINNSIPATATSNSDKVQALSSSFFPHPHHIH